MENQRGKKTANAGVFILVNQTDTNISTDQVFQCCPTDPCFVQVAMYWQAACVSERLSLLTVS